MEEALVKSTPPPHVSITPPPSSQFPTKVASSPPDTRRRDSRLIVTRTPTPTASLSSPPPTVKAVPTHFMTNLEVIPSPIEISNASPVELHEKFQAKADEMGKLSNQLQEARTSAAHFKLQHNLLSIEATEAANRMEVEQEIIRREVEVLQSADLKESRSVESLREENGTRGFINAEIAQHAYNTHLENQVLAKRLERAKKLIARRDGQIEALLEMNAQLKLRIRENREHMNQFRAPGGPLEFLIPQQQSRTAPNSTPRRVKTKASNAIRSSARSQDPGKDTISALLLADQVLHQEQVSAPSTPARIRSAKTMGSTHTRGAHSLSSLPITQPQTARSLHTTTVRQDGLLPPVSFTPVIQQAPLQQSPYRSDPHRRRVSRDSTISASDSDERRFEETDEEVPESSASQLATSMLRHSQKAQPSTAQAAAKTGSVLQAKILGTVRKSAIPADSSRKRMRDQLDVSERHDVKRIRPAEGVGLGIGWSPS